MGRALVRGAQALTAAAALFTVLWGCGYPANPPPRPVRVPRGARLTDALTGSWQCGIGTPPKPALLARMVIAEDDGRPVPRMTIGESVYGPSRSPLSARIGTNFVLHLRNGQTLVTFTGRIAPRFVTGTVVGLSPRSRSFVCYPW